MSKNITIQEGGTAKQLTVDKLKTNLAGGGTCLWVPEDIVTLGTKTITENGTYKASDENLYGYSQVTVSGIGKAIGKGADGNEHIVTSDENGNLVTSDLPSSIAVVAGPTRTVYADGDAIDFAGLTVKAYKSDGTPWEASGYSGGVVPDAEQLRPVTEADFDACSDIHYSTQNGSVDAVQVDCVETGGSWWTYLTYYYGGDLGYNDTAGVTGLCTMDNPGVVLVTQYDGGLYAMRLSGVSEYLTMGGYKDGEWNMRHSGFNAQGWRAPVDAFGPVCIDSNNYSNYYDWSGIPVSTVDPTGLSKSTLIRTGGTMKVPIKWPRPGDGRELEAWFEIDVGPGYGGE